jgi:hypothetical protein
LLLFLSLRYSFLGGGHNLCCIFLLLYWNMKYLKCTPSCFTYSNCLNQNWTSEIALRRVFSCFFIIFFWGGSLNICDEPRCKNVDPPPPPYKFKNFIFLSYVFCKGHCSWNFTRISLNRKEIQRVVLIPLMQKFLWNIFIKHIHVSKEEEGHYKSYNLQGVYLYVQCLFVGFKQFQ